MKAEEIRAKSSNDAALKAAREISHYVSGQNDAAFHAANSLCEQHEGKLKTAKQNCEAIAAIIRKHLAQRDAEVIKALEEILARLPDDETIHVLKADAGLGFRKYPMTSAATDEEILRWRSALRLLKEMEK